MASDSNVFNAKEQYCNLYSTTNPTIQMDPSETYKLGAEMCLKDIKKLTHLEFVAYCYQILLLSHKCFSFTTTIMKHVAAFNLHHKQCNEPTHLLD